MLPDSSQSRSTKAKALLSPGLPPTRSDKGWMGQSGGGLVLVAHTEISRPHLFSPQKISPQRQARGPHIRPTPPLVATREEIHLVKETSFLNGIGIESGPYW
jgi:hypothetical protein